MKAPKSSTRRATCSIRTSYIFNYPEPFKDVGVLAITHINPTLDIYTMVTSGQNTTLVAFKGDNNSAPAFEGGFGLTNCSAAQSLCWRRPTSVRKNGAGSPQYRTGPAGWV